MSIKYLPSAAGLFLAGLAAAGWLQTARADDASTAAASTNSVATTTTNAVPAKLTHQLTGAELYSIHCNRCHAERFPTERTAAQWKTIMLHMQIRANIPVKQSKLILQYLQENSGR
jgi:cytochrome c5